MSISATATAFSAIIIMVCAAASKVIFGWLIALNWGGNKLNNLPIYSAADYKFAAGMILIGFVISLVCAILIKESFKKATPSPSIEHSL